MYTIEELNVRLLSELKKIAEELGLKNFKKLSKKNLINTIMDHQKTQMRTKNTTGKALRKTTIVAQGNAKT